MILNVILGSLAGLSLVLLLWQWLAATRFPLHQRVSNSSFAPAVTILKPLKGSDAELEKCLRSWFAQEYSGTIQILLGVHCADDPACVVVKKLLAEFPQCDAQLVLTAENLGTNGKVSNLAQLARLAKHEVFVISDGDVRVPPDFLANAVAPSVNSQVGLVNCFYGLANPTTLAMHGEAIAVNADFWSQVLQSKSLKPLDFAMGAVMITRRKNIEEIGGFESLADCLADDYQLGNRIARKGHRIELCPVVVECWDPPQTFKSVWKHQLRWARTIRVCQPVPYFFSILSNVTVWSLLWLLTAWPQLIFRLDRASGSSAYGGDFKFKFPWGVVFPVLFCLGRIYIASDLQRRLMRSSKPAAYFWLVPVKDFLQALVWVGAFCGNKIEWRGLRFYLRKDGTLVKIES